MRSGQAAVIRDLARLVGGAALVDAADQARYEQGYRYGGGQALAVVRPASIDDVRSVVKYCYANIIPMVAQGANTGLVAASTPDKSGEQLVVSFERLAEIEAIEPLDRSAVALAGARLSALNARASGAGLMLPIDLSADPTLGGMISTNTGGGRLIRYGGMRRRLMGLQAVLADQDATLLSSMKGLRKDNSRVDLSQLLVGAGGAFGLVVRAQVELQVAPRQTVTLFVVPDCHEAILEILHTLERQLGDHLTACEGLSRNAITAALTHQPALRDPFAGRTPDYALLVEFTSTADPDHGLDLMDLVTQALASIMESAAVRDVLVARPHEAWALRHAVSEGAKHMGSVIGIDLAVPRTRLPAFRKSALARVASDFPDLWVCDFGHCGDGGDHFNIVIPPTVRAADPDGLIERVRSAVYEIAIAHGGTFSAEHGLGPYNRHYYERYTSVEVRQISARLKTIFDPRGLLGNVDLS